MDNRIKIRHLRCFLEVARLQSVVHAAESLKLAQPAVSRSLSELEKIVGVSLLERGRHGSQLTEVGKAFHDRVAPSVEQIRRAYNLATPQDATEETISIGALPTVTAAFLPEVVTQLKINGFGPAIRIIEGNNIQLLDGLRRGEISIVLGRLGAAEIMQGLSFEHLYSETICCCVHPNHPLISESIITTKDIAEWPVITHVPGTIPRSEVDRQLHSKGVSQLRDVIETNSVDFARRLTMVEDWIWIVVRGVVDHDINKQRLALLELTDWTISGSVGMTTNPKARMTQPLSILMDAVRRQANHI